MGKNQFTCREAKTRSDIVGAIKLRVKVFVVEQGIDPDVEMDALDGIARHFVATASGKIVATARVIKSKTGEFKIQRMAVAKDFRGRGVGTALLRFILAELKKEKPKRIWLEAQAHAREFYEKNGFYASSGPFDEVGIPHIAMDYRA